MCGVNTPNQLCDPCRARLASIWKIEEVACVCPVCGASPLEAEWFLQIYPDAARAKTFGNRVLITFTETGCHRCAPNLSAVRATIWQVRNGPAVI